MNTITNQVNNQATAFIADRVKDEMIIFNKNLFDMPLTEIEYRLLRCDEDSCEMELNYLRIPPVVQYHIGKMIEYEIFLMAYSYGLESFKDVSTYLETSFDYKDVIYTLMFSYKNGEITNEAIFYQFDGYNNEKYPFPDDYRLIKSADDALEIILSNSDKSKLLEAILSKQLKDEEKSKHVVPVWKEFRDAMNKVTQ